MWRRLCGPYFLNPPRVEHLYIVVEGRSEDLIEEAHGTLVAARG